MKNSSPIIGRFLAAALFFVPAAGLFAQTEKKDHDHDHSKPFNPVTYTLDETKLIDAMRKDGASNERIISYIEWRRKQRQMEQSPEYKIWQERVKGVIQNSTCNNDDIGVELGNFGTWTGFTGSVSSGPIVTVNPATLPVAGQITIAPPPATDPCATVPGFPIPLPSPSGGKFSIQLGNNQVGAGAERIEHTFVVQPTDTNFIYQYAVVFEDPGHSAADQPFMEFVMYDQNNSVIPCSYQKYVAGASIPGFQNSTTCTGVTYKPWTTVGVNLSPYVGTPVKVRVTNADCTLSGHFGYSYLDFACGTLASSTQFCIGEDSVLLTAPYEPGFTYSWSTGATTSSIIANPQLTTSVIVSVIPPSNCSFFLVYNLLPTIINSGFTHTVSCNQVSFTDTTSIVGGTITNWQWSFPGGSPSSHNGQNPPTVTYPISGGTYSVTLQITSQANCKDTSIVVPVTIQPPPVANAGPDVSTCNTTATLCASGGVSYAWQPGGFNTSCITVSPSATTNYTVTVTDAGGCTATDVASVTLNPPVTVNASQPDTICIGQSTAQLNANASPGCTFSWVPNIGLTPSSTIANPTANPPSSQTYTVYVVNAQGCTDADVVPITVAQLPYVSAIASTTICVGDSAQLNANASNGVAPYTYYWTPPNSLNNPNLQNPLAGAVTSGGFSVTVTDAYGCTDDTSTYVYVQTVPSVSWASWTPDVTCDGYVVPLNANVSSNGQYVYWDFGDGTTTTTYAPNTNAGPHLYPFNGSYNITVIVHNPPCKDTIDTTLVIGDIGAGIGFCEANVFTPNGDADNPCFRPAFMHPACNCTAPCAHPAVDQAQAELLATCMYLEVYDRWGIKMFETTDTKKCWDGTTKGGSEANEGTYYYIAKLGEATIRGYVTLLRKTN